MSVEANKALAARAVDEVINGGRLDVVDQLYAQEIAQAVKEWVAPFRVAFPDVRMETVALVGEGDTVVGHFRCSGTYTGQWMGRAPTGRRFTEVREVYWFTIRDSRIVDWWGFGQRLATQPAVVDPGLACDGVALFRALPADADREVPLVTDLHVGNVLAARREPWLVIDAKPYVGDPAYDGVQHLLNCAERLQADPAGLAARMARLLEMDPVRLRRWLFARCMLESPGEPPLADVARRLPID